MKIYELIKLQDDGKSIKTEYECAKSKRSLSISDDVLRVRDVTEEMYPQIKTVLKTPIYPCSS